MTRLEGEEGRVGASRGGGGGRGVEEGGTREKVKFLSVTPAEVSVSSHRRPRRRFETFAQRTYCPELKKETKR